MNRGNADPVWTLMGLLFRAHPWHGVPIGDRAPESVTAYIEIVPTDTVKYELDKITGNLMIDRPQRFSNVCPTLYGFIPQTFCGEKVAEYCEGRTGRSGIVGDGDALDICVLTERVISHADVFCQAVPIGGLRMLDGAEADDKIVAILEGDPAFGGWKDIGDCPSSMIERLQHYFLTYKQAPGETQAQCEITDIYGAREAREIIQLSREDYGLRFSHIEGMLTAPLRG